MTWTLILDDTFARSDTSAGSAGSTTGAGNNWTDVHGGVASISSDRLKIVSDSIDGNGWARDFILRPTSENQLNQRITTTISAQDGFADNHAHVLRYNVVSGTAQYYCVFYNWNTLGAFNCSIYNVNGTGGDEVGSDINFDPTLGANTDLITCDTQVTGTSPTSITVTITDATTSNVLAQVTRTDTTGLASNLTGSGQYGLVAAGAQGVVGYVREAKTYYQSTATISVSPTSVYAHSTGNSITVTGVGTNFSGTPFTVSSGTITGTTINSATSATITFSAPSSAGSVTLTDTGSGATTTITVNAPSVSISPTSVNTSSTGNTITLTGTGTQWTSGTPGSPTFTVSAGTITAQHVTSATSATLTYSAPSTAQTVTITDPQSGSTASLSVATGPATGFSLTPGSQSVASGSPATITCTLNGTLSSNETIALSDGGGGGSFSPTSLTFTSGNAGTPQTFTYTPAGTSTYTITGTGSGNFSGTATCQVTGTSGPVTVAVNNANVAWSPYNWYVNGSSYAASVNPGAYVKLGFTGTSIKVNLNISAYVSAFSNTTYQPILRWYIDNGAGGITTQQIGSSGTITLATGLASGNHQLYLEIVSNDQNVDRWGTGSANPASAVIIDSFTLDAGASTIAPPVNSNSIIIYGDSIVEGVKTLSFLSNSNGDAVNNDAGFSWAAHLGKSMQAEYGQIGFGGLGWTCASSGGQPPGAPPFFTPGNDTSSSWDKYSAFASRLSSGSFSPAPTAIFICLGTNDVSSYAGGSSASSPTNVAASVAGALSAIRTAAGSNCWIFVIYEMAVHSTTSGSTNDAAAVLSGYNTYQAATPDAKCKIIDTNIENLPASSDPFFNQSNSGASAYSWDGTHPNQYAGGWIAGTIAQKAEAFIAGSGASGSRGRMFLGVS